MKTLGVDLAAQAKKTAACMVEWSDGRAAVTYLDSGLEDSQLINLIHAADKTGIDAPSGGRTSL